MSRINRRKFLTASSAVALVGLAGCGGGGDGDGGSGDGDGGGGDGGDGGGDGSAGGDGGDGSGGGDGGGTTSLSVGIPGASTTTGAASNSFQRVVDEQSPDADPAGTVQWNNQETGGDPPSLRQYNQGNVQAMTGGNFIIASALQDAEPFQQRPVEDVPHQAMSIASLHMHVLSIQGSGVETTDDLVGTNFWPLPPAWGLRQQAEAVFGNTGLWSELEDSGSIVDADTGDVAGAIEEERVDALIAYGASGINLAGWATEVDARADLQLVEMTDEFVDGVNATRGTSHREIEPYGWENQSFETDTVDVYGSDFQFWFGSEVSRDVGYELARISSGNVESIREGQPAYMDHSDPEVMTELYLEDHPVHPGPYDYLEEQGVDVGSYTRGEAE